MAGRHAYGETALETLNSPKARTALAAVAVGSMFGVALPMTASSQASGTQAAADLTVEENTALPATLAVTAPEGDAPEIAQVSVVETAVADNTDLALTIELPVVEEEAPAEAPAEAQVQVVEQAAAAPAAQVQVAAQAAPAQAAPAPAAEVAAPVSVEASGTRAAIVAYARQFAGTPYVYGGATPGGFDCSGFVSYVFNHFGYGMGRTTGAMAASYRMVSAAEAQPGDLVMWGTYHVGIYTGNGQHIAAHRPGKPLSEGPLYGSYYFLRVIY